jgi:hypothetical protein
MIEYLGNCSHIIDWTSFISDLEKVEPMIGYQYSEDRAKSTDVNVIEIAENWRSAGYNLTASSDSHIAWDAWYSGVHFDNEIEKKLCSYLKLEPIDMSMVTRLKPGKFAPWHWDVRDKQTQEKFESYKEIVRIHIHMSQSDPGHVFVIEDNILHGRKQGDIIKWPHWKAWHGGGNCGLTPKYQFSIIGINSQ